jgi:predicted Holliday junction resolvase-like endonuclease
VIQVFLVVILALVLAAAAATAAAAIQGKRAKKALAEAEALRGALSRVEEKAGRLRETLNRSAEAEEKADGERAELSRTSDSGLVGRANSLFLPDSRNGRFPGGGGSVKAPGAGGSGNGAGGV